MKRVLITAVAMIFLLAGCAAKEEQPAGHQDNMAEGHGHDDAKVTKHFDDSLTKLTDKGLYSLELVIPEKHLMMGVNTV